MIWTEMQFRKDISGNLRSDSNHDRIAVVENFLVAGRDGYPVKTIGKLLGDCRVARGQSDRVQHGDEHRPVTIEDVISPVPMNPSFISEKAKSVEIRSVLAIVDS